MATKPQLVPSGLASNVTESQLRDVQNIPWAGARVYQTANSTYNGRGHFIEVTNVVYDTHGFYYSGGTFRIPFTGIYEVTAQITESAGSIDTVRHGTEIWLGAPGSAFTIRLAYAEHLHHAGGALTVIAIGQASLIQGDFLRLAGNHNANATDLGGADLTWFAIHYLGPPRQSQVG